MAKSTLKEGDIIQALQEALPAGAVVRLTPGPGSERGISDTLITWRDREYLCEIKVNDMELDALQAEFLANRANPILLHVDTKRFKITYFIRRKNFELITIMGLLIGALKRKCAGVWIFEFSPLQPELHRIMERALS